MKRLPVRVSALSMAFFWAVQAIAQPAVDSFADTDPDVRFSVDHPIEIERATILNKLRWAGSVFIDPDPNYELIPLFGYPISQISGDSISIDDVLAATMAGDVRIAILTRRETGSDSETANVFEGRGVHIADGIDEGRLLAEWNRFREGANVRDGDLVAFSRPLRGMVAEEEFVATSRLWPSVNRRLTAMDPNSSVTQSADE